MRRIASLVARRAEKPDAPPSLTSSNDMDAPPQDTTKRKGRTLNSLSRKLVGPLRSHVIGSDSAYSSSSASSGSAEPRTPEEEMPSRTGSQRGNWRTWLGAKKDRNGGELKAGASLPPFATTGIALRPLPTLNDTDDTSSELEDDLAVSSITQARDNMRAMIVNSVADPPSYPALLDVPGSSLFPRSCLSMSRIHVHRPRDTLESKMHKRALSRKLETLSPAEERSIAPLGARPAILVKEAQAHDPNIDTWPKAQFLRRESNGLGNWVDRPCFEDRVVVWTRQQEPSGKIVSGVVAGPQLGVAALEFSESLQILAGWLVEPEPEPEPEETVLPSSSSVAEFEFSPVTQEMTIPKQEQAPPPVKRGVRFAEDGKDDQIPLGYVLRIKQRREEKARFLRQEREKRELEEARKVREEERRRQLCEAEKRQRRASEQERRRQNYSNDLQASRARREASRAGHISSSSSLVRDIERDRSASRPRALDLDGSPASSMPATPQGSQPSFSRPPSVYSTQTTSSEDTRARDGRRISRHSTSSALAFDPSKQSLPIHRPSLLPYNPWSNVPVPPVIVPQFPIVPQVPVLPMMTYMPFYSMDIPLLPPSPPFMMNQFGYRQRPTNFSQNQFQHSSSSNYSAERVHPTSPTHPPPAHQRRASDDARTLSGSAKIVPGRKYGSQPDLPAKRSPQVAHSSRGSNLHHSHRPSVLAHSHTSPPTQSRPTPNHRQSMYS